MSDLSELFARDPVKLTDQDIDTIVARMRQANANFELGVKAPKTTKPAAEKSTKTQQLLKDLGL